MPRVTRTSPPDARARTIFRRLRAEYPDARCSLTFRSPWELLVATILSAQCTDDRVNMVTPGLFERFPTPEAFAGATQGEVEEAIRSTGFFRNKAKAIIGAPEPSEDEGADEGKTAAAEQLIAAVKGDDAAGVVVAFKAMFDLFESEPHEEYGEDE